MLFARTLKLAAAFSLVLGGAPLHAQSEYTLQDLMIAMPMARATPPNAPVAAGFLTVTNTGENDDRLVAARSDVAGRVEIHEMAMDGDVMKMRELADGLPIPSGETVVLQPGGIHLMFMELKKPLVEGATVDVTLVFGNSGEIEVTLVIGPPGMGSGRGTDSPGNPPAKG